MLELRSCRCPSAIGLCAKSHQNGSQFGEYRGVGIFWMAFLRAWRMDRYRRRTNAPESRSADNLASFTANLLVSTNSPTIAEVFGGRHETM